MAIDWSYGSLQDLTNGGADNLTAITVISGLSNVDSVTVMLKRFSASGTGAPLLQLGDASWVTSGYVWSCNYTGTTTTVTTGFLYSPNAGQGAGDQCSVVWELRRVKNDIWQCFSTGNEATKNSVRTGVGTVDVGGDLQKLQITSTGGSITFDNGDAIARYR